MNPKHANYTLLSHSNHKHFPQLIEKHLLYRQRSNYITTISTYSTFITPLWNGENIWWTPKQTKSFRFNIDLASKTHHTFDNFIVTCFGNDNYFHGKTTVAGPVLCRSLGCTLNKELDFIRPSVVTSCDTMQLGKDSYRILAHRFLVSCGHNGCCTQVFLPPNSSSPTLIFAYTHNSNAHAQLTTGIHYQLHPQRDIYSDIIMLWLFGLNSKSSFPSLLTESIPSRSVLCKTKDAVIKLL